MKATSRAIQAIVWSDGIGTLAKSGGGGIFANVANGDSDVGFAISSMWRASSHSLMLEPVSVCSLRSVGQVKDSAGLGGVAADGLLADAVTLGDF